MNSCLAKNLKELRLSKKLTQEQVAQALSVSPKAVSRWECGSTMPDILLLPDIARLYCVTVDDLFKENSIAYENYAQRLMSVYEQTHDPKDFLAADAEFDKLIKSGNYTMKDICIYGILYQFHSYYCKDKALELFQKGIDMDENTDPDTYHWIERQRMAFLADMGKSKENISFCQKQLDENPGDLNCHINLAVAYFFENENKKSLAVLNKAKKLFGETPIMLTYRGDIYYREKEYDKAISCWDKAMESGLNFSAPLHSKAECLEAIGEYEKAYKTWCEITEWYEEKGYEIEAREPRQRSELCKEKI